MDERRRKRMRSQSPDQQSHIYRERSVRQHHRHEQTAQDLPFSARELTKHDLPQHRPLFTLYLDIQKRLDIEELSQDEIKGRWKSFVHKWNRGELANGWYDPNTLSKAKTAEDASTSAQSKGHRQIENVSNQQVRPSVGGGGEDEDFGPTLPLNLQTSQTTSERGPKSGPTIPTLDDLRSRNEDARISVDEARNKSVENRKLERKLQRKEEKEQLEDIAPQAQAGTRERQLEKRREAAASNRAFAASKEGGGDVDLPERDVMGGDDLGELKRMRQEEAKRKTEREIKREEILRARAAEREERTQRMRAKEEKTMSMLKELARSRYGDGNMQPASLREE